MPSVFVKSRCMGKTPKRKSYQLFAQARLKGSHVHFVDDETVWVSGEFIPVELHNYCRFKAFPMLHPSFMD